MKSSRGSVLYSVKFICYFVIIRRWIYSHSIWSISILPRLQQSSAAASHLDWGPFVSQSILERCDSLFEFFRLGANDHLFTAILVNYFIIIYIFPRPGFSSVTLKGFPRRLLYCLASMSSEGRYIRESFSPLSFCLFYLCLPPVFLLGHFENALLIKLLHLFFGMPRIPPEGGRRGSTPDPGWVRPGRTPPPQEKGRRNLLGLRALASAASFCDRIVPPESLEKYV